MFLPINKTYVSDARLIPGDSSLLGKSVTIPIERTYPISAIVVRVCFVTTSTALTLFPATAQTPDNYDNILTILRHVVFSVNEGASAGARKVVDCDGIRLLEYNLKTLGNLDSSTMEMIRLSEGTTVAASTAFQLTYLIPLAERTIAEPLHSRLLLPAHKLQQDPQLTLTFNALANMASAGGIATLSASVQLIRAIPSPTSEAVLLRLAKSNPGSVDQNGYLRWDLLQQDFSVASVAAEQKFDLALGGSYVNLLVSQYGGGTNVTRNSVDAAGIGDTVAHGFGAEDIWRLETAGISDRQWRWRDEFALNQYGEVKNVLSQTSAPTFGGPVIASTNFQGPSSVLLDFLRDGVTGDNNTELGSVLNCNLTGSLKKQMIGKCATWATNQPVISCMGRRLLGDLSPWQGVS